MVDTHETKTVRIPREGKSLYDILIEAKLAIDREDAEHVLTHVYPGAFMRGIGFAVI